MKRSKFKKHRARLRKLAEKWIGPLGLKWWTIENQFCDDETAFEKPNGDRVLMRVQADWRYRTASISINVPLLAELTDEQLEHDYLHELMHIFLSEMRMTRAEADASDHEERTAQALADAFLWCERAGDD